MHQSNVHSYPVKTGHEATVGLCIHAHQTIACIPKGKLRVWSSNWLFSYQVHYTLFISCGARLTPCPFLWAHLLLVLGLDLLLDFLFGFLLFVLVIAVSDEEGILVLLGLGLHGL